MSALDDLFGTDSQPQAPGLKTYKTASEAYREDVAPRRNALENLFGSDAAPAPAPVAAPAPKPAESGDFGRGWGIAGKQLRQTAYGTAALIGDTVGADSLKQWGLKGYKEAEKEIEQISKPTDSFTTAWEKGGGALVDWMQYGAGYLSAQAAETLVAAGAGAVIGGAMTGPAAPGGAAVGAVAGAVNTSAARTGIKALIGKMVDKEADKLIASGVAANVAAQQAAKSVYRTIGATAGQTLVSATQELGSIYGEAVDEAKGGTVDLSRVWLAGVAATAVESWANSKALKGLSDAYKGTNRASSIAIEAFKGGLREGMTEGVQTAIERFGATKDLTSAEAYKEYIDSVALGVLGGSVTGGASGGLAKLTQNTGAVADPNAAPGVDLANPDPTRLPEAPPGDMAGMTMNLKADVWETLQNAPMVAAMYMRADPEQQKVLIRAIDRANLRGEFEAATKDAALMERNTQVISEYPEVTGNLVAGLEKFANTLPWPTVKVDYRTTGGTLADEERATNPPAEPAQPQLPEVEPPGDPSVAPTTALPERTGPEGDQRNDIIRQFNEVGSQIFGMSPGQVQDAKFDWAMNQLVQTHGFSTADARSILTGQTTAEAVAAEPEAPAAPQTEAPTLEDQGVLDEAVENAETQESVEPVVEEEAKPAVEEAAEPEPEGKIPRDIRGVKLTEENRQYLDAYFTQEIADNLKKKDGKGKTQRLEQLEKQALKVGFKQAEVDEMFGRPNAVEQAKENLKDSAANLFDVLTDVTGAKQNITGQKRTVSELPSALIKVMEAVAKLGYVKFKDVVRETMRRMRENKTGWAELADKVSPNMLREAYNAAKIDGKESADVVEKTGRAELAPLVKPEQKPAEKAEKVAEEKQEKPAEKPDPAVTWKETANRGQASIEADDLDGATMQRVYEAAGRSKKKNLAGQFMRQAITEAKSLLNGRVARIDGKRVRLRLRKPNVVGRATSVQESPGGEKTFGRGLDNPNDKLPVVFLDGLDWKIFNAQLLDDGTGAGAAKLRKIRQELNRVLAILEKPTEDISPIPRQQTLLDLAGGSTQKKGESARVKEFKKAVDDFIRSMTNASYYEATVRILTSRLAEVDAQLEALKGTQYDEEDGSAWRTKNKDDERPGLWGIQDENAYDRFEGGAVFDKATPKNELLDIRKRIENDLRVARESSIRGQARLYRLGMERLHDFIMAKVYETGTSEYELRDAALSYLNAIYSLSRVNDQQQAAEPEIDPVLAEANRNLEQQDFLEGERVAMVLLADFKAKRISASELEALETRGMKEGDFTFSDLFRAYRAFGVDVSQVTLLAMQHFSSRVRLDDYVAQNGGLVSAADAWFLDMEKARSKMLTGLFPPGYTPEEIQKFNFWVDSRRSILGRRRITEEMRESKDPRTAFRGFLFTRITLDEARNPQSIGNVTLRQNLLGLFPNLEDAWFQDLATALRRRPDLASSIFNGSRQTIQGSADVATNPPVVSVQEKRAFDAWVERIKAGVKKEAEVAARIPYFAALRTNLPVDAVTTREGFPTVSSTPTYDETILEPGQFEQISAVSLANEAEWALKSALASEGYTASDVQRVEPATRNRERGQNAFSIVLKDGKVLRGEQMALFQQEQASRVFSSSIAIPELMTVIAKKGLDAGISFAERQMQSGRDARFQPRRGTKEFMLGTDPQQEMFVEPTAGRPVNPPSQYEQLYIQVYNNEFTAVQELMDSKNILDAIRAGRVDPETGEILTQDAVDQLNAEALRSVFMNAMMGDVLTENGTVRRQFGAKIDGDEKVVRTVEEAAERDAQLGNANSVSIEDLSSEEQIQEGAISEFEGETQERADEDSEVDEGRGVEQEIEGETGEKAAKGGRVPGSLVPDMEYRFRRGKAWDLFTLSAISDVVRDLTTNWTNAPNIVVLPNPQHLPAGLRERVLERLAGSGAKGLYHDGTVYLFAQFMESEADVEFTLFHEAYGHLGMRAYLGAKFDSFLETAYRTRPEVRKEADALMASGMPKLEAIDEVLSDMAATDRGVGIVKQWVGKIIAGLREAGFGRVADWLASMTDAEVSMTLAEARKAAREGKAPAFNGTPSEIRFKLKDRPPYEVFSTKDGKTTAYARYNPATDTWAVFHTFDSQDIRDNYSGFVSDKFDDVVSFMRKQGKVDYRTRSGLYIDDKIVGDLVRIGQVGERDGRLAKWWRAATIAFQNEYLPVFEVVDYLRSIGRIDDRIDVKTALLLYERRTSSKLKLFRAKYVNPIMELAKEAGALGAKREDIDRYLAARHAEERNRAVAAINKDMPDGGSGLMTTPEGIAKYPDLDAYKILADLEASPAGPVLKEIGLLMDQMSEEKVAYLSQTGLITKSAAKKLQWNWNKKEKRWDGYQHYVNLSGVVGSNEEYDDPQIAAGGSKFNAQKAGERRAFGRGTGNEAPDVLGRTIQSFEAALIRGQKNLVAQKVLALIETNYDPNFAVINKMPTKRKINSETGLVEDVVDENYMARKDVMVAKVGGVPVTIEFKDTSRGSFAEAIHGYVAPRESNSVMEWIGKANQIFGQMLTTWNPAWMAVNFVRDVQTLFFNSAADGRITKKMAADMMKTLPSAIKTSIYMAFNGKLNLNVSDGMIEAFNEMDAAGGQTSFANFKDLESRVADIEMAIRGKTPFQRALGLFNFMEKFTLPFEVATRFAAYKVVRDNGWTPEQAAVYSGEVTVNFNLRGNQRWVRQLFVFFNPAVQGTEKLWRLAKENPKRMAGLMAAWAGLGMMATLLARSLGDDDEDDKINPLDKIAPFKRATSIVLSPDTPGAAIPIPYGWNAPYAFGTFLMDSMMGVIPWDTSLKRAAKAAAESLLPPPLMQGADSKTIEGKVAKTLSPTLVLPITSFVMNENRYGAPIYKGKNVFDDAEVPDAQKYFRGVSPISKAITDGLTEATGGNKYKAGGIDVNPATLDFLIYSYLPGVVSESYKMASTGVRAARGEEIKRTPLPLIDRFTAPVNQGYEAGAYRRAAEIVETLYKEYDNTRDQGRRQEIREEFPRLSYAHATIASTKRELRDINKRIAELDTRPISADEKVRRLNELRKREERVFKQATNRLMEAGPQVREAILANE